MILRRPHVDINVSLSVAATVIPPATSATYLGITLDEHLTFIPQVERLRKKVSSKLGTLVRIRSQLTCKAKRTFYLSFIQSTLEYASNSYVHALNTTTYNNLLGIAKRALRLVFGFPSRTPTSVIINKYRLTPPALRFHLKLFMLVRRLVYATSSPLLCSLLCLRSTASQQTMPQTRGQAQNSLVLPAVSTRYGYHCFSYLASDRWNSLPPPARTAASPASFKKLTLVWLGHSPKWIQPVASFHEYYCVTSVISFSHCSTSLHCMKCCCSQLLLLLFYTSFQFIVGTL